MWVSGNFKGNTKQAVGRGHFGDLKGPAYRTELTARDWDALIIALFMCCLCVFMFIFRTVLA